MKPHLNHPFIGKICQYKAEHYGKVVFSWHKPGDKLTELREDGHVGWINGVLNPCLQQEEESPIIGGMGAYPISPAIQRAGINPYYSTPPLVNAWKSSFVFYDTKGVAPNIPWTFSMPWGWMDGINHIDVIPNPELYSKEGRAKIILNPCEAVTFKAKIGTISVGTTSYLKCLITNPRDDDPKPRLLWIRDTWIAPHTGFDSYEQDFRETFQKKWLRKLREEKGK